MLSNTRIIFKQAKFLYKFPNLLTYIIKKPLTTKSTILIKSSIMPPLNTPKRTFLIPNKDNTPHLNFNFSMESYVDNIIVLDFEKVYQIKNDIETKTISKINQETEIKNATNTIDHFEVKNESKKINICPYLSNINEKVIFVQVENIESVKEISMNLKRNKVYINNPNSNEQKLNITIKAENSSLTFQKNCSLNNLNIDISHNTNLKIDDLTATNVVIKSNESSINITNIKVNELLEVTSDKSSILIENIKSVTTPLLQTEYDINTIIDKYPDVNLLSNKSDIIISKISNCNLDYKGNQDGENNIRFEHMNCNVFNIGLGTNDKVNLKIIKFNHNSIIKTGESGKLVFKVHPMLGMGINMYFTEKKDFIKWSGFDRVGYSFCPTLLIDSKDKLDEDIFLWEALKPKFNPSMKMLLFIGIGYIVYSIFMKSNNFYEDISSFKMMQIQLNKVSNSIKRL